MRELLKRVLMAKTIGYPLPPSLVKDIEAELAKPEPEPEPVAWIFPSDLNDLINSETYKIVYSVEVGSPTEKSLPLYTHPPAQKKPLSDDECLGCRKTCKSCEI